MNTFRHVGIVLSQRGAKVRDVLTESGIAPPEMITNLRVFHAREMKLNDRQITFPFSAYGWWEARRGCAAPSELSR